MTSSLVPGRTETMLGVWTGRRVGAGRDARGGRHAGVDERPGDASCRRLLRAWVVRRDRDGPGCGAVDEVEAELLRLPQDGVLLVARERVRARVGELGLEPVDEAVVRVASGQPRAEVDHALDVAADRGRARE